MKRAAIVLALWALAGCGDGARGPAVGADGGPSDAGSVPSCVYNDAAPVGASPWKIECPEGMGEVCDDSTWECSPGGWSLYGESPRCDESDVYCPSGGEPHCVALPEC